MRDYKRKLIGVKGHKGAGKTTVADMINYILHKGIAYANYHDFLLCHKYINSAVINFADKLKQDLSKGFNIPLEYFYDAKSKEKYYCFNTGKLYDKCPEGYNVIHNNDNIASVLINSYSNNCIKIRTLMQYYGTELIKNQLYNKYWINICINDAYDKISKYNYCIIGDVRFEDEANTIKSKGGIVIRVDGKNIVEDNHESEIIYCSNDDIVIDNTGSMLALFYKVLEVVKKNII